jgi:hypothetical protein
VIRPGAVKTEIWGKAVEPGVEAYAHTDYAEPLANFQEYAMNLAKGGYSPEEFGGWVVDAFEARRLKTRYAIVPRRLTGWTIPTLLPDRLLDRLVGRSVGLLRR